MLLCHLFNIWMLTLSKLAVHDAFNESEGIDSHFNGSPNPDNDVVTQRTTQGVDFESRFA